MADLIGWIGTIVMIFGSVLTANHKVSGWYCFLAGNVLFCTSGYMTGLTSLVAVSILMGALDLYGIYKWTRHESNT